MQTIRFNQACEDSSEFTTDEVTKEYLQACMRTFSKRVRGDVVGYTCINKFRKDEVRSVPDRQAKDFIHLGVAELA